jgi:UMF1 family MFS transporter
VRGLKTISLFLLAYWLYIDGVDTIIVMAVDYGLSLGFRQEDLILALLLVQFVGFPCAIAFGRIADRIGTKRSILLGIGIYLFVTVWGAFIRNRTEFYIMAVLIGMVQGGVQALSRSFFAKIIPEDKAAQYFGFYNMLGKFAAIIGPLLVGTTVMLARSLGASPDLSPRISISSIAILFITGGIVLLFVDEQRGKQEAGFL